MAVIADAALPALRCVVVDCPATVSRLHGGPGSDGIPAYVEGSFHFWGTCRDRDKLDGIDFCPPTSPDAFDVVEVKAHWVRAIVAATAEAP
jgi:hypothetical protein